MADRVDYAAITDLLLGDISFTGPERTRFLTDAHNEVDEELGYVYTLPLGPTPFSTHVALILKRTTALIASGRLILDRDAVGEDMALHAYGQSLLQEGMMRLAGMRSGAIDLVAVVKIPGTQGAGNAPSIIQGDTTSGVDAFYGWINSSPYDAPTMGQPWWQPGVTV